MAAEANADAVLAELEALSARLAEVEAYLHIEEARGRVTELEEASAAPGFWDDAEAARAHMAELAQVKGDVGLVDRVHERLSDARAALELADEMGEDGPSSWTRPPLPPRSSRAPSTRWSSRAGSPASSITVAPSSPSSPGRGGLEAQDWTFMLFKMYMKYCARRGWKVTVNDCPAAEVIGIDRATITVEGKDAFGMLRAEAGVHRLVRISPTDAKKRRQTTFAGVEVIPVLPDDIEIEVAPDDIRVDVYHASGPGGQGVNTTDSAVRVTHIPTGIVVTCQNERSQIQNKAACMQILKARLYELELEKRAETLDEIRGPKTEIGFGNQIRSYVLYPYQMVKDLRSGWRPATWIRCWRTATLTRSSSGITAGRPSRRSSGCIVFVRLPLLATHRGKGLGAVARRAGANGASARFICRGAYR